MTFKEKNTQIKLDNKNSILEINSKIREIAFPKKNKLLIKIVLPAIVFVLWFILVPPQMVLEQDTDTQDFDFAGLQKGDSKTEYGIGFTHSLGGATRAGGVSRNYKKDIMADLGVRFTF
ncbi:MAG: hypothetical protein GDA53_07540 [Rhodobacteraceae bacterium]|nr:hypothetical protein [Paracoccaceae bacterium]